MSLIELEGISKRYGDKEALSDVNLEIKKGEIFAIMGNSGAGKTTLLRIMAMLEKPDGGNYIYDGGKVEQKWGRGVRRLVTIAMVFQRPVMFNTSIFNNIAYGLRLRGYKKREVERKVMEVLGFVKLGFGNEINLKANARKLSGGEQQRVAIARCLVLKPDVLLMDEPTANLDPSNVIIIEDIMRKSAENGTTIVLATHNLFQARRISHRVMHLYGGRVVEVGEAQSVFEKPQEELTRKFINGEIYY